MAAAPRSAIGSSGDPSASARPPEGGAPLRVLFAGTPAFAARALIASRPDRDTTLAPAVRHGLARAHHYLVRAQMSEDLYERKQQRSNKTGRELDEEIEKLRYDLHYVKNLSPWLDLQIIVRTIRVLFFDRMRQMDSLTYLEEYSRYHAKDDD